MKGVTKIQLFDAKTKEQVYESTHENMMTNAIPRLLNPRPEWAFTGNTGSYLSAAYPLSENALGGLLLWDEEIEENADIVLPPDGVHSVAHAGGPYAGTNVRRGTYNQNESGAFEGGYKHVWDFSTDKGNGTIKCVSLTSVLGGNCGWVPYWDDVVSMFVNHNQFKEIANNTTYDAVEVKHTLGRAFYHALLTENSEDVFYSEIDGKIYKNTSMNCQNIKVGSKPDNTIGPATANSYDPVGLNVKVEHVFDLITPEFSPSIRNPRNVYYMGGKIHHLYHTDANTIRYRTYTLAGELVDNITISTTVNFYAASNNACMFYFNEKYYAPKSAYIKDGFRIYDLEGAYIGDTENTSLANVTSNSGIYYNYSYRVCYIPEMNTMTLWIGEVGGAPEVGAIFLGSDDVFKHFKSNIYTASSNTQSQQVPNYGGPKNSIMIYDENPIFPYILLGESPVARGNSYGYSDKRRIYLTKFNPYLATINNLSTPVEKTNALTMKVSYTIYDA